MTSDIRTKIEGILKERRQFDENHMVVYPKGKPSEGRIVLSLDYVLKLESLVRASVGLVEQLNSVIETSACLPGRKRSIKETLAQFAAEVERVKA